MSFGTARCRAAIEVYKALVSKTCQKYSFHQSKGLSRLSFDILSNSISPPHTQALVQDGFVVIDNALDAAICDAFRREIRSLREAQKLHLNSTHLVKAGKRDLLQKTGIYEAEVADTAVQEDAPAIAAFQRDRTMMTMFSLFLPQLRLHSQLIKLQYNAGDGGCFPLHYDSDESIDARRVTAILYLNPGWEPAHGGELQLFPWPDPPVTIQPLNNRLVIFSTCRMLHRVLPSLAERYCLTTWMSVMKPGPPPTPIQHIEAGSLQGNLADLAAQPEVWRALTKVYLKDLWAQSLISSHAESEGRAVMLATFWKEVEMLQEKLGQLGLEGVDLATVRWF